MTAVSVLLNIPEICTAFKYKSNEEVEKKLGMRKGETYTNMKKWGGEAEQQQRMLVNDEIKQNGKQ